MILDALSAAHASLERLGRIGDADKREIAEARAAFGDALEAAEPARHIMDLAVAVRIGDVPRPELFGSNDLTPALLQDAAATAAEFNALHFPVAFPEVFVRSRSGFDAIIGNPARDKVRFEAQQFWVTRAIGLNALPDNQRDHEIATVIM